MRFLKKKGKKKVLRPDLIFGAYYAETILKTPALRAYIRYLTKQKEI